MLEVPDYVGIHMLVLLALPFACTVFVNWIRRKCVTSNTADTSVIDASEFPYKFYFWFCTSFGSVMAIITSFPIYHENPHNLYCDPALVDGTTRVLALYSSWNGKVCQITVQTYYEAAFAFCAFFLLLYLPLLAGTTLALIARALSKLNFVGQLLRLRR